MQLGTAGGIALWEYVGAYAPLLLFFAGLFALRSSHRALLYFGMGSGICVLVNLALKGLLQQPRPKQDRKVLEMAISHGERLSLDKFGMPSGHAQYCSFVTLYVLCWLAYHNRSSTMWLVFLVVTTSVSLMQRWWYRNHTVLQLAVGLGIGAVLGVTYAWMEKESEARGWIAKIDDGDLEYPSAFK